MASSSQKVTKITSRSLATTRSRWAHCKWVLERSSSQMPATRHSEAMASMKQVERGASSCEQWFQKKQGLTTASNSLAMASKGGFMALKWRGRNPMVKQAQVAMVSWISPGEKSLFYKCIKVNSLTFETYLM